MSSEVCGGLVFTALQTSLSTAVGVSLAFPILSQIIESKSLRIIQECRRVLGKNKIKADRVAFREVGSVLTGYQFFVERLSRLNEVLMMWCAFIGTIAFSMIITSTLHPTYCMPYWACLVTLSVLSSPFSFGLFYLLYWFDKTSPVKAMLHFYDRYF
jgi:hypothetical protein